MLQLNKDFYEKRDTFLRRIKDNYNLEKSSKKIDKFYEINFGDFVDELNDNAQGGMDNETVWSVSNIQSGVYLARIEAVSSSGKSEFAIIKIAVVK